jgi:hypothetical protein
MTKLQFPEAKVLSQEHTPGDRTGRTSCIIDSAKQNALPPCPKMIASFIMATAEH